MAYFMALGLFYFGPSCDMHDVSSVPASAQAMMKACVDYFIALRQIFNLKLAHHMADARHSLS